MFCFHALGWVLFGLVVGIIARFLMPGQQAMGWLMTIGLGIAGSFVGGAIGSLVFRPEGDGFPVAGWIFSILGALLLLFIYGMVTAKSRKLP